MKKLPFYIFFSAIICVMFSCYKSSYDSRLMKADSILLVFDQPNRPDLAPIAKDIINKINPYHFDEKNLALYYYLRTYTKYRCYDTLTEADDSVINYAISYFENGGSNRDITRSYIMKGAIQEELGNSTKPLAHYWYTRAIDVVDTNDYLFSGMAHYRLASFYESNNFADSAKTKNLFLVALENFKKCGDSYREYQSMMGLCNSYVYLNNDSSIFYGNKAYLKACELNDTPYIITSLCSLSSAYYNDSIYRKAIDAAHMARRLLPENDPTANYQLIISYLRIGMKDSADYYFKELKDYHFKTKSDLQLRQLMSVYSGDYKEAYELLRQRFDICDVEQGGALQKFMISADEAYKSKRLTEEKAQMVFVYTLTLSILIVIILLVIIYATIKRKRHNEAIILVDQLERDKINLEKEINANNEKTCIPSRLISKQLRLLFAALGALNKDADKIERTVDRFRKQAKVLADDNFFKELETHVNIDQNNIMKRMRSDFSNLDETDWKIVLLVVCGCSTAAISMLLNYKNHRSVCNRKNVIASKIDQKKSLESIVAYYD